MSNVEKVSVALPREMTTMMKQAVETGEYASASEVVREALRDWKERRDLLGYTVEELRKLLQEGLESGPGRNLSAADIKAEGRRRLAMRQNKA
jgi:antitoxin ParD1/3/4